MANEFVNNARGTICYSKEATYGVVNPSPSWLAFGHVNNVTIGTFDQGFKPVFSADASSDRIAQRYIQETEKYAYNVKGFVVPGATDLGTHNNWMKYVLGALAESGSDDAYTHTITVANALDSITTDMLWRHSSKPFGIRFLGGMINKAIFEWKGHEPLQFTLDILAQSASRLDSALSYTEPTQSPFFGYQATTTIEKAGSPYEVNEILSGKFEINNNLAQLAYADDANANLFSQPHVNPVSGVLELEFVVLDSDYDFIADALAARSDDVGDTEFVSGINKFTMNYLVCAFKSLSKPMPISDGGEVKCRAIWDVSSMNIVVTDDDAAWAGV